MQSVPVVINAGIGGNNTRDLMERLERDVLAHHPTLVCLLVGTNDMLNAGNSVPLAEYQENVGILAERIRAQGSALLLMTILPCYEPYLLLRHAPAFFAEVAPNARVRQANAFLADFCACERVPLVDLYTPFAAFGELGESSSLLRNPINAGAADGVHPTAEGYLLIAALVVDAILRLSLPAERTVCVGDSITRGVHMPGEGTAGGGTYPAWLAKALAHAASASM